MAEEHLRQASMPWSRGEARPRPLALTVGDPAGIGPEVVARWLAAGPPRGRAWLVIGHVPTVEAAIDRWAPEAAVDLEVLSAERCESGLAHLREGAVYLVGVARERAAVFEPGCPSAASGAAALAAVALAGRWALRGAVAGLVTGPLSKAWVTAAGHHFTGHTEFLAHLARRRKVVMTLVGGGLRVGALTTHMALRKVPAALRRKDVERALRIIDRSRYLFEGARRPRIALCGLNPHAGEEGLFGTEEARILAPAVGTSRRRGLDVEGPLPADTLFGQARRGRFDYVLALYHDQAMIPVKVLAGGQAVNVTLGLPFLRTSVDHGTAFDIAGQGRASASSLAAAAAMAHTFARRREGERT